MSNNKRIASRTISSKSSKKARVDSNSITNASNNYPKRRSITNTYIQLNKKQQLEAINRFCNKFYPKFKAANRDNSLIKQFIEKNKPVYP